MKKVKREQVIEAARKLFHQFGFKKVSMEEIAKEAGVTKKTIYMYFASKEELLKYFIQEEITNMEKIVEKVEAKHQDFFETVNEAIYEILQYRKHQDFLNIIAKEAELIKNPKASRKYHTDTFEARIKTIINKPGTEEQQEEAKQLVHRLKTRR